MTAVETKRVPTHEESARHVLESLGGEETFELAFFTGSAAIGLAHDDSDVDVHVVLRPGAQLERTTLDRDGRRVQLKVLEPGRFARLVSLAEEYVVTREDRSQAELDSWEFWNLIRLAIGQVVYASDEYRRLLERTSFDVVRRVVAANFSHRVARTCESANGMLGTQRLVSACHIAALAMASASEVALALAGDVYAVDRFLAIRLERSSVFGAVFPELWDLLYRFPRADADADSLTEAALGRMYAASGLVAHSLLYGWERELTEAPALVPVAAGGPVRVPSFGLLRFADAFGLAGRARSFRVGEPVAAVWAACDGSPVETIAERVQARGYEASAEAVSAAIESLFNAGAVTFQGERPTAAERR